MLVAYPPHLHSWDIMSGTKTKRWEVLLGCFITPTLKGVSTIHYLQLVSPSHWHSLSCWKLTGARGYGPCHWHHVPVANYPSAHIHTHTSTCMHTQPTKTIWVVLIREGHLTCDFSHIYVTCLSLQVNIWFNLTMELLKSLELQNKILFWKSLAGLKLIFISARSDERIET